MGQVDTEHTSGLHWPRPGSEESEQGGECGHDRLLEGPCFPAGSPGLILELVFSTVAVMPWIHWAEGSQAGSERSPRFPHRRNQNQQIPLPGAPALPGPEAWEVHPESSSLCAVSSQESLLYNFSLICKNTFYALF